MCELRSVKDVCLCLEPLCILTQGNRVALLPKPTTSSPSTAIKGARMSNESFFG